MWIKFTADFEWKPKRNVTMTWRAGDGPYNATRECAEAAIKAGAAVELKKANKDSEPTVVE